jgi:hypothetical protein
MLSDAMSIAEWATLRHLLALWRRALVADVAASNGLTTFGLAGVLAEHVFGDTAAAGERCALANARLGVGVSMPGACVSELLQKQRLIWGLYQLLVCICVL